MPFSEDVEAKVEAQRMRALTAILLHHPGLVAEVGHAYNGLDLPAPLGLLREALIRWSDASAMREVVADRVGLHRHLVGAGLKLEVDRCLSDQLGLLPAWAMPGCPIEDAAAGWWHIFGCLNAVALGEEIALAEAACSDEFTAANRNRLLALKAASNSVERRALEWPAASMRARAERPPASDAERLEAASRRSASDAQFWINTGIGMAVAASRAFARGMSRVEPMDAAGIAEQARTVSTLGTLADLLEQLKRGVVADE